LLPRRTVEALVWNPHFKALDTLLQKHPCTDDWSVLTPVGRIDSTCRSAASNGREHRLKALEERSRASMVPDYYARLEVDPAADRAEIEAALLKKQPVWSMGTRNPKTRHANQLFLDEIPALRRALLGDPASRAAYDAELAMVRASEREQLLDQLQRKVRLRAAKGGLGAADRKLLTDEAVRLGLTEEELLGLTRPIPNLVEAPKSIANHDSDDGAPPDVLDPSTRRQIQVALEHLGRRDLYDALGVARDAHSAYISSRADEERQRWMKKTQVTAEKTAWLEVIAHAQSHLTSSKARKRYDRTLALEAEESFEALASFAIKDVSRLDQGTLGVLIEEAAAAGVSGDRADWLIAKVCRRLGVERALGAVAPLPNAAAASPAAPPPVNGAVKYTLVRCRHCGGVTELSPVARKAASARCRHCGASLKWDCPICRRNYWVDEKRCGCGFRGALRQPLERHFEAARQAFRNFDLNGALEHLERVLELAPNLPGARKGIARVRQRQADIARVRMTYESARAGGRLFAARAALEAWSRLADSSSPDLQAAWGDLSKSLAQAEKLAAMARQQERVDPPAARSLYRQSLAIAADLPDAVAGLGRTPPDAPTALDAQVLGDRVRLSWSPPPPDGLGPLTFIVVRKRGGALEHPGDGTRIAEISTSEYDDMHAAPGESVGYAVLSKRGGVESITAISLGPVMFLADVKDARVEFRDQEIELVWTPPRGVSEVRVVRKQGAPPRDPRDGERLATAIDHLLDRNLDPNEVYHYGLFAIYKMPDGRLYPSPGVIVSARPDPPVSPLDCPRLVRELGGRVRIDWAEPVRGTVAIVRTPQPLPLAAGTRLAASEAESLAVQWIEPISPGRAYDDNPPADGPCYYTPLTHWNGNWTVGHGMALNQVSDPSDLRATRASTGLNNGSPGVRVTLRWKWAPEAIATLIAARQGVPPEGPSDPAATTATVFRFDYDRQDCWTLNLPVARPDHGVAGHDPAAARPDSAGRPPAPQAGDEPQAESARPESSPWHIRVYSIAELDGVTSVSPGLDPTASTTLPGPHPEVTVSYVLKRPWLPLSPWSVKFRTEPPGMAVPPMVLVANPRAVPLSADDGETLAEFPAGRDGDHFPIRSPVKLSRYGARVFPNPKISPDAAAPIRLRHPETGTARV
jgi:hypothetical protein